MLFWRGLDGERERYDEGEGDDDERTWRMLWKKGREYLETREGEGEFLEVWDGMNPLLSWEQPGASQSQQSLGPNCI